jgi:hypothetical protein
MDFVNFVIAVVALLIGIMAYRRSGGDWKGINEQLNTIRKTAAEALEKAEKAIRPGK